MLRVGAHVSINGGISQAVERAAAMGGNCMQIFSSSPRMWFSSLPKKEEIRLFKELALKHEVGPVFIHAKYLVNLASMKKDLVEKSVKSLKFDFEVADLIGAEAVIVHLGSHLGSGFEAVRLQLVKTIKLLLQDKKVGAGLLIENSAGQKGKIASQLSEIRLLLREVNNSKLGWCLDTCHAWAAGYSCGLGLVNSLYENDIVKEIKKLKILDKLKCLHVNDSRDKFASGRDRHDNLGEGMIGLAGLKAWVNRKEFKRLPMITEVPGFDKNGPDKKNLDILKSMIVED